MDINKSLQHLKNKDAMVRCSAATVLREVAASGVVAEDLCPNIMVRTSLQNLRDGKRLSQHHCEASRSVGAETLEKLAKNNTIPGDLRGDVVEELLKCIKVMRPEYTHNRWGRKVMCKSSTVDDDYADVSSTSAAALGELAKFGGIPEDQRVAVIKRLFHGLQDVHARRSAAAAIGEIVKSNIVPQDLRQAVIHKLLECVNDEDVHQIAVSSLVKLTFEQSTSTERVNSSCEDADEDMAEGENEDEEPTNACRGRLCSSSEATVQDLEWRGDWHKRVLTGDIDEVLQLIMNKDGGVDEKEHGLTALHLAAIVGDGDVALALIQAGADMNARDSHGQTPLHLGVLNGHPHILELLLNWHATDVHSIDNNSMGAFIHVVRMISLLKESPTSSPGPVPRLNMLQGRGRRAEASVGEAKLPREGCLKLPVRITGVNKAQPKQSSLIKNARSKKKGQSKGKHRYCCYLSWSFTSLVHPSPSSSSCCLENLKEGKKKNVVCGIRSWVAGVKVGHATTGPRSQKSGLKNRQGSRLFPINKTVVTCLRYFYDSNPFLSS
eukprot:TRINITY_DN29_c0_g1_i1.p1 TRINITY_DN29_c0_g1~~TRINITY_DN29_c0_g1_i1.p1  ORF type:complete len:551 (+),score=63.12 TRINITY_DN29_c0_g1_i1:861-2513(+)